MYYGFKGVNAKSMNCKGSMYSIRHERNSLNRNNYHNKFSLLNNKNSIRRMLQTNFSVSYLSGFIASVWLQNYFNAIQVTVM